MNHERIFCKMIDETDLEIIKLLVSNSRMQWQEIGEKVHLTGQGVRNRISRMEKEGIIEGYTLKINQAKLGLEVTAFVTVFMKTTDHMSFQKFLGESYMVAEAYRISGDGCYLLKLQMESQKELVVFLDKVLHYGNYKVNLSIDRVK